MKSIFLCVRFFFWFLFDGFVASRLFSICHLLAIGIITEAHDIVALFSEYHVILSFKILDSNPRQWKTLQGYSTHFHTFFILEWVLRENWLIDNCHRHTAYWRFSIFYSFINCGMETSCVAFHGMLFHVLSVDRAAPAPSITDDYTSKYNWTFKSMTIWNQINNKLNCRRTHRNSLTLYGCKFEQELAAQMMSELNLIELKVDYES